MLKETLPPALDYYLKKKKKPIFKYIKPHCNNCLLTTADPTATPAAVVAIWANKPGCLGCAMAGGWAGGACAGTGAGAGDTLLGAAGAGAGLNTKCKHNHVPLSEIKS